MSRKGVKVVKDYIGRVGDTLSMNFSWKTGATVVNDVVTGGTLVDMSGYTARMHVKSSVYDIDPIVQGAMSLDGNTFNISCKLTPANTIFLGEGDFVYDIEITDSIGNVFTFAEGKIKLYQSVTI